MKRNYFRKYTLGLMAMSMLTLSVSGCQVSEKQAVNGVNAGILSDTSNLYGNANAADTGSGENGSSAEKREDSSEASEVRKDKVYGVGSVSKVFATTTVLQLADRGLVDLDGPVTDYIPEFTMADERYKDITVRMLMNHTSGIQGTVYSDSFRIGDNDKEGYEERFLKCLSKQTLRDAPGHSTAYCNDGFGLLEIITERVSGKDFTTYLQENVAAPLNAPSIGTPVDSFLLTEQAPTFEGKVVVSPDYCLDIGGGGVLSNARDLSIFGSAFFRNNEVLLSNEAKKNMEQRAVSDPYMDGCGLGWDVVSIPRYEEAGVKVLVKGGDLFYQHASLVVAPEEEISVAVLSSGGNSGFDQKMAEALLDIALEEKGIGVKDNLPAEKKTEEAVPEKYLAYAGYYTDGAGITEISFPDGKYARVKTYSGKIVTTEDYLYTADEAFVKMTGLVESGKAYQGKDQTLVRFTQKDGKVYVVRSTNQEAMDLGRFQSETYALERIDANPVPKEVQDAWNARGGDVMITVSEGYSSAIYHAMGIGKVEASEDLPGYVTVLGKLLKIVDENTAVAFLTIPSSTGRDQTDLQVEVKDGKTYYSFSNGLTYLSGTSCKTLTKNTDTLTLDADEAVVYKIGEEFANALVQLETPKECSVFTYDRYGNIIYSSNYTEYGERIPLPKEGYLVLRGKEAGDVKLTRL